LNLRPFALERFFARHEFDVRYLLCSSDPEPLTISEVLALESGSEHELSKLRLGYVDSRGGLRLREAIAGLYEHRNPEMVLAHGGSQEPIFILMQALINAGDHVIVQFPAYQSQYSVAQSLGAEVSRWDSDLAREGAPDPLELERLVRPETRLIIVTTPNNPTGFPFSRSLIDEVVRIARRSGAYLLGDEVYRGSEREAPGIPAVCDLYERGISLGGMSKVYGLAGLRVGWISTQDRTLYDAMATVKDYLTICNSAPSEFLAALAVRHQRTLVDRVRAIAVANLNLLDEFFSGRSDLFQWVRPRAGTTAFPAYLAGSSSGFCSRLLETAGVLLLPSEVFDAGDQRFRIGYGRTNLPEALSALAEFVTSDRN